MLIFGIILCAKICAQNYSNEVTLVQGDDNSVTVLATAVDDKKKDAASLAAKSAFHTLFHSGVPGVKNGVPMIAVERSDYDYRFFSESRYINYIGSEIETVNSDKIGGKYRVTVKLTIQLKSLCADLERNNMALNPGWSDAKAVKATAALNPTIVIVPDILSGDVDFELMRKKVAESQVCRYAIDRLSGEFQKQGFKTRDFISQLQNLKTSSLLTMDSQTDEATMIVQRLPGDIVVYVEVQVNTNGNKSNCIMNLRAVEKQTNAKLSTVPFSSGEYITTDSLKLVDYTVKRIKKDFFDNLQASFEDIIKKGREVFVEIGLSQAVTDWDFDQDSPATGDYFKDSLDEWLREHAFQGVYDMSNNTDKYINIRVNIPLWNMERNRSYTLSNFSSDIRNFLKKQLGDDYKPSVVAMGTKLVITIE